MSLVMANEQDTARAENLGTRPELWQEGLWPALTSAIAFWKEGVLRVKLPFNADVPVRTAEVPESRVPWDGSANSVVGSI